MTLKLTSTSSESFQSSKSSGMIGRFRIVKPNYSEIKVIASFFDKEIADGQTKRDQTPADLKRAMFRMSSKGVGAALNKEND